MKRRVFLISSGLSAIAIAVGIRGYNCLFRKVESRLATQVKSLFDPMFRQAAKTMEPGNIFTTLRGKGVILENGVLDPSVVTQLAKTDQIIMYEGRYYTQTELELYCLAYVLHKRGGCLLQGHHLDGGDVDAFLSK